MFSPPALGVMFARSAEATTRQKINSFSTFQCKRCIIFVTRTLNEYSPLVGPSNRARSGFSRVGLYHLPSDVMDSKALISHVTFSDDARRIIGQSVSCRHVGLLFNFWSGVHDTREW